MNLSFKSKLIIAFVSLCTLMLIQSTAGFALTQRAQFFENRSLLAQELLVAYTNIGADKQRLKVWYAELLLTGNASITTRDTLIDRINSNIQTVREKLPLQLTDSLTKTVPSRSAPKLSSAQMLDVIEKNFANFRRKANGSDWAQALIDKQQVWRELLNTFDVSSGLDVRVLIAQAIEEQSIISARAKQDADTAVKSSNRVRLFILLLTLGVALILTWYFIKHLTQPIADLMLGTRLIQTEALQPNHPVVVPLRASDEFGTLASSFNSMAKEIYDRRVNDLNQKEQLENAVKHRTKQLVEANHILTIEEARRRQFLSDLSHELRTPATAILGEAEVALRGTNKPIADYRLSLENIASTTRELTQRINSLLLLAKGKLNTADFHNLRQPLLPIIQSAIIQARAIAKDSQIEVFDTAIETIDFEIDTDANRLQQLLMLFYDNAIRYTPPGGSVYSQVTCKPNGFEIRIDDTGIGITDEEQSELFTRHFRGEKAREMRSDGAGLGLAIAKTLAQALRFTIAIEPGRTNGCSVRLTQSQAPM